MKVYQFVMAYKAEQDRLRAMLPEGFESLRPVLRINAELRGEGPERQAYLEFNTPVAAKGKRGWLNIGRWSTPSAPIAVREEGTDVTFETAFLRITWTGVGRMGGCPAEKDNDGCFFEGGARFVTPDRIDRNKEHCDCAFAWAFAPGDGAGESVGGGSVPAFPTDPVRDYPHTDLTPENAAAIPCQQVLGAYRVRFER